MLNFLTKLLFCKHHNKKTIYIQDRYHDMMTDNDDLEDIPTYIKITYCTDCGKILEMYHVNETENYQTTYLMGEWVKVCCESDYSDICEFELITGFDIKNITSFDYQGNLEKADTMFYIKE